MKNRRSLRSRIPLISLIALILLSFFAGVYRDRIGAFIPKTGDTVSALTLRSMLKNKKFTLINVHVPYEGEIENTDTFVAYDKMVEQSAFLPKDKNTPIILYCKTGRMSGEAILTMQKLVYTNVRHLAGGMEAWKKARNNPMDLSPL